MFMPILQAFRIKIKERCDIGKITLRQLDKVRRFVTLIEVALAPNSHTLAILSCSLFSFLATPHVVLKVEAPWQNGSKLTLANTRASMSLTKEGVTTGVVVVAVPTSKQWATNICCGIVQSCVMQASIESAQRQNSECLIRSGNERGLTLIESSILIGIASQKQL